MQAMSLNSYMTNFGRSIYQRVLDCGANIKCCLKVISHSMCDLLLHSCTYVLREEIVELVADCVLNYEYVATATNNF